MPDSDVALDGPATTVVDNVQPVSADIAAIIDKEFDREPDAPHATLPPETWDDNEAETQDEEPANADSADSSDTAGEPLADKESSEEPEEPSDEPVGLTLEEKANAWDKVVDAWSRDPAGTLQKYLEAMPDADRARLLDAVTGNKPAEPELDFPEEAETPFEEVLLKRKEWLLNGEQHVAEMLNQQVESLRPLVDNIWHLNAQQAVLQELIESVADGLPQPTDDMMAAIIQDVQSGKAATFKDAVKKRYSPSLGKAIASRKQAEKPRPSTPANEGQPLRKIREGMSMLEIAELLGVK